MSASATQGGHNKPECCERTQVQISLQAVVFIMRAIVIDSLGHGCTPLLRCSSQLSLPPCDGKMSIHF